MAAIRRERSFPETVRMSLGLHPFMNKPRQRVLEPRPHYDDTAARQWFEECYALTNGPVDGAALYQAMERMRDILHALYLQVGATWKIGRVPVHQIAGDLQMEPSAIRGEPTNTNYDGSTDLFSLDRASMRYQGFNQLSVLDIESFEWLAWHDPQDFFMRQNGFLKDDNGKMFYELGRFEREFDWGKVDWGWVGDNPVGGLQDLLAAKAMDGACIATKYFPVVPQLLKRYPGKFRYIMHCFTNLLLSRQLCALIETVKQQIAMENPIDLDMGGIYGGGAFATNEDLTPQLQWPRKKRKVFNYENATDTEIRAVMAISEVAHRYGVTRPILAAEFAGALLEYYPFCRRVVSTSSKPSNLRDTFQAIGQVTVPDDCWNELIVEGHVDPRCREFLLPT